MKRLIFGIFLLALFGAMAPARPVLPEFPKLTGPYLGQPAPGAAPAVFAPGIVSASGRAIHGALAVSPDGTEIFWPVTMPFEIRYSRLENGNWTVPAVPAFTQGLEATAPVFSPDGRRLYFTSQIVENRDDPQKRKFFIWLWYAEKKGNEWSKAQKVEASFNDGSLGYYVSLTKDGTLYFSTDGIAGGKGGEDLYYSRMIDGKFSAPVSLGDVINSELTEGNVYVAPEEDYLLFTTMKRLTERPGIVKNFFCSFKKKDGAWSTPRNIGEWLGVNDTAGAIGVSSDQKFLFFSDITPAKRPNLYWMEARFIQDLKAKN
jgi:hypothetical protein